MPDNKNISIFKLIANGDLNRIKSEYENEDIHFLLGRNHEQNTPLSQCLRYGHKFDWINNKGVNQRDILSFLLEKNAERSIFVKGYLQDSLVCTLPMIKQPPSTSFEWPSPISIMDPEILLQLDNFIAAYLENLKQLSDAKKKKDDDVKPLSDLDFDDKGESDNDNSNNGSESATRPSSPDNDKIHNFYPKTLKVGDRVRRGVNWAHNQQDHYNEQQCEGVVKEGPIQDSSGNDYYKIAWLSNPKKSNSELTTQNYYYYTGKHSVFRVNIKDRSSFPSNVTKPNHLIEGFKLGDLVSTTQTAGVPKLNIGAVIEASETQTQDFSGKKDFYVSVLDLKTGNIMNRPRSDLQFADDTQLNQSIIGSQGSPFKAGDKVRIRPNATDKRGCLYEYEKGFVGTISSINSSGNVSVVCNDAALPQNSSIMNAISGNFPNYTYKSSDLMHSAISVPLIMGDIVEFNSDFYKDKAHKDGWCLGTPTEKKKGIVVYSGEVYEGKQRDIEVCALDNIEESYRFRSDWLQRVSNDGKRYRFRVGDRVRLDNGNWDSSLESSSKCLGASIFGNYGIVISEGVIRNGIQRNIGVTACTGEMKNSSSFYPSFALAPALERFAVMTDDDMISLTQIVKTLLIEASLSAIDGEKEVKMRRVAIWHYLHFLPTLDKNKIKDAFEEWNSQRNLDWPSDEVNVHDASLDSFRKMPSKECLDNNATWTCENPKCLTVGGYQNSLKFSKCRMCNFKAPQWTCEFCSTKNDLQETKNCVTCCVPHGFKQILTRLFELAKTGTIQEFKDFVDSSDDIKNVVCSNTAKDFNENSLLANAYDAKNTDIVRYFLEELKFDGNVTVNGYFEDTSVSDIPISNDDTKIKRSILGDKYSLSLIEFAALRNDYEFIDFLLNFLPKTKNEVTGKSCVNDALNLSTVLGHELCIPSLLNHKDIDLSIDSDILFECAILNHANMEPVIRALLTSEIPKEKFITGKNLYLALTKMNGKPDIFEMLLSHSIDIRKPLVNGWNLLHIAAHEGFTETLRFLLSDKVGNSESSTENCQFGKFDINAITDLGWTALHQAIFNNNTECLNELLNAKDIDVNILSSTNYSPLSLAIAMKHSECIEALLKHDKLNVNHTDTSGRVALHVAAIFGNTDAARRLLSILITELNIADTNGDTSLHFANSYGHHEIVELLLNHPSIEINQKNGLGLTPVKLAQKYGHTACFNLMSEIMEISEGDSPVSNIPLLNLGVTSSTTTAGKTKMGKKKYSSSTTKSVPAQQNTSTPLSLSGFSFGGTTNSGGFSFNPSTASTTFAGGATTIGHPTTNPLPSFSLGTTPSTASTTFAGGATTTGHPTTNSWFEPSIPSHSFGTSPFGSVRSFSAPVKTPSLLSGQVAGGTPPLASTLAPSSYTPFKPTQLAETGGGSVYLLHIAAMEEYKKKSPEELRLEFQKKNTPAPSIVVDSTPSAPAIVPLLNAPMQPNLGFFPFQNDFTEQEYNNKIKKISSFKMGSKATPQFQTPVNTPLFTAPSTQNQPSVNSQVFPGPGSFKATISPSLKKIATLFANKEKKEKLEVPDFSYVIDSEEDDDSDIDDNNDDNRLPEDYEIVKNNEIAEDEFTSPSKITRTPPTATVINLEKNSEKFETENYSPKLERQGSDTFYKMAYYVPIEDFDELLKSTSKDGNTAGHYLAQMGLAKSVDILLRYGVSEWTQNFDLDTITGIRDGLVPGAGEMRYSLHKILSIRHLLPTKVLKKAINTPFDYCPPHSLNQVITAIKELREEDADWHLLLATDNHELHVKVYRAIFRLEFGYGIYLAKQDLEDYIEDISQSIESSYLDPVYYYAIYLLWKKNPTNQHAKIERLKAYDSLRALSFFPEVQKLWLDVQENHVQDMQEKYPSDLEKRSSDLEEDDYSDLIPPPGPNDPENVWIKAKKSHKLVSASMDRLMSMIGLKEVKKKTVDLALKTLLDPPADVRSETSVNLLFVGNSGTGKSTVGTLVAQALAELGFRKNPNPVMVAASDILGACEPEKEFLNHVQDAENGTLFIDEAGLFDPAPKGSRSNDSNKVLDALMKVSETMKHTTTFILAGYKDDINKIMGYNQGFRSRFPKKFEFEFNDYTEIQLTKIISEMLKQRNLRFESVKECGVPIARVLARRLHKGANKPGFGNGRACEKELESCIQTMDGRLSRLLLAGIKLTDYDYRVITRGDSIGERPHIEDFPEIIELKAMVGLRLVKESIYNIINLALQNYDAEMRGDPIQEISLHRVFLGNPGTGKTTIARLFGKILKVFKLLSDGDFIVTTPSDLKGVAVGEAAERTKNLLDSAKGKVLFIDEAYNLDPKRHASGGFGKEVIDTIVEKINGAVGQDIAVIFAGYKHQMEEMLRNCDNPGIARRLNLAEAFIFEDFSDEEIKIVLKNQIVNCGLTCEPSTLDFAVKEISKKRMQEMFGNAGEAEQILTHAKLKMSARISKAPPDSIRNMKLLIQDDFAGEELSVANARAAFADLMNIDHITAVIDKFEGLVATALEENRKPSDEIANMHMLFLGPPGTGKTTAAEKFAIMMYQLGVLPTKKFHYVTASNLIDRYVGGSGNNMKEALERAKGGILFIDEAYGMLPPGRGRGGHSFGGDLMQILLDNITTEEYNGKILVILGGYKHQVEELFEFNPGFQSRFDKMRIEFPAWTGKQASDALIQMIERDGKVITEVAKQALPAYFDAYAELPNWASARDVKDIIRKNMEVERSTRSFALSKEKRQVQEALQKGGGTVPKTYSSKQNQAPPIPYELEDVIKVFKNAMTARGGEFDSVDVSNYRPQELKSLKIVRSLPQWNSILLKAKTESERILVACVIDKENCISSRKFEPEIEPIANMMNDCNFVIIDDPKVQSVLGIKRTPCVRLLHLNKKLGEDILTENIQVVVNEVRRHWALINKMKSSTINQAPLIKMPQAPEAPQGPAQLKHKFLVNEKGPNNNDDDEDDDIDVFAALEAAMAELGYSPTDAEKILENKDFPPQEILNIIMRITGCSDVPKLKKMLLSQRQKVLEKVKFSIKESKRAKSQEEEKVRNALAAIGKCCMGYEWLKTAGGYRCAGGSHFCTDDEVIQQMND